MLVIQHNCEQKYKNTVIIPKTAINIRAEIVMIQKLFIGSQEICYNGFNFY